jgi:hypothetical protein
LAVSVSDTSEDGNGNEAVAALLCSRIPGARSVMVPGGTHAFAHERPDEVAGLIRDHLSGTKGGPRAERGSAAGA